MMAIELKSVSKTYGRQEAVSHVSLEVQAGERLVITGPSGCGKSTILRLVAGFVAPDSGSIVIDGQIAAVDGRIVEPPEARNIGMVFQDLALWPHLTVWGNLEFGLKARRISKAEREARILETLRLVELVARMEAKPAELSGGQQQRIALARALVLKPKILLMDEPLSNLDLELNIRMRREIMRLQKELGFTLLYITHSREEAAFVGSRVAIMNRGKIEWVGTPEASAEYFRRLAARANDTSMDSAAR